MEKLVITVAPNGGLVSKKDTPHVPITPEEIAEEVLTPDEVEDQIAEVELDPEEDYNELLEDYQD